MRKTLVPCALLLCAALLAGCTTSRSTAPLRTASEQLLLSAAAERQVVTAERANRIAVAALIFVGASFLLSLGALLKRHR